MKKLIGLYSPAAGSGKSTVAKWLEEERGYTIVPFAQTLKEMLIPMLKAMGYDQADAEDLVFKHKQVVVPSAEVSVRHMLRTLGTEWGRSCIHPDIWLRCWSERIKHFDKVVVDDCRFRNEAQLIKNLGGELWYVERPGIPKSFEHSSEGSLNDYEDFDCAVFNDGAIEDLTTKLRLLAKA